MASVILENVSKHFGSVKAVSNFTETIGDGEFVSLLGPSGCGKTTALRIIAGFEKADTGSVYIGDRMVSDSRTDMYVPPEDRNIGMVFQSYAVWPHMNVFSNVAYPLKVRHAEQKIIREKVANILDLVHLTGLEKRLPSQLSGGQQQRVALARALIAEPALLLLDEPLSNLDAKLRESMRFEIKDVQRRLQITVIYVTHDQSEAMVMSDRIVIMDKGIVQQTDIPRNIYESPANRFVADFIGLINFFEGKLLSIDGQAGLVEIDGIEGPVRIKHQVQGEIKPGTRVTIAIRPEAIALSTKPLTEGIQGRLLRKIYLGNEIDYRIALGDTEVRATGPTADIDLSEGKPVWMTFEKVLVMTR
ncbi:MAG: ABC transporter ATP-binding protein [Syntrophales bacterium]|nr:ABC transporter ATP-binding protein [Syntrophales bacterium]